MADAPGEGTLRAMVATAKQAPASLVTTEVLGLLTVCPWTQTNPDNCGLHEIRKLPLAERYTMVRHASADDLAEFAQTCDFCPLRRQARHRW